MLHDTGQVIHCQRGARAVVTTPSRLYTRMTAQGGGDMNREIWNKRGSTRVGNFRIFSVRLDRAVSPDTGYENDFTILETVDWVNVVALTAEGDFILVRQFRHGTEEYTVEIPGGAIDPGDTDPAASAVRELEEETGYIAERIEPIGVVEPNPAFQTNRCYTFLAQDARPVGTVRPDPGEEIEVFLATPSQVDRMVRDGEIRHALVIAALFWLDRRRG